MYDDASFTAVTRYLGSIPQGRESLAFHILMDLEYQDGEITFPTRDEDHARARVGIPSCLVSP